MIMMLMVVKVYPHHHQNHHNFDDHCKDDDDDQEAKSWHVQNEEDTRVGVGDVCFFLTMRCFNDAMFSHS